MQYMIGRLHKNLIQSRLAMFPAVAILGPRQCGKTTLSRELGKQYFDLEMEGSAIRLDAEWNSLIESSDLIVLDEAQESPELFPRLRGTIDQDRKRNGRFLLLRSVSPYLIKNISESLAGRLGIVELSPFLLPEVGPDQLDKLWLYGGYPDGGILDASRFSIWQESYLNLITQRDLPNWGLPATPQVTDRLMHMLAALQGQALNYSQLGTSLSLDSKTVGRYCDYLEGAFLIRRLPPYSVNISKRLRKSHRVYLRDSGLLHSILNVTDHEHLYRQPWVGQSWEGFVIEQTLATLSAVGHKHQAFYFRTADEHEIDLVLEWKSKRWAIEIKLTSNPSTDMLNRLRKSADLIKATQRVLLTRIKEPIDTGTEIITNLPDWLAMITK